MPYLLLILEPRGQRAARTDAEGRAVYDRMVQSAAALNVLESFKHPKSIYRERDPPITTTPALNATSSVH